MTVSEETNGKRRKVLVADNFRSLRVMIKKFLGDNYHVIEARTGEEVISLVEKYLPYSSHSHDEPEDKRTDSYKIHNYENIMIVFISIEFSDYSGFEVAAKLRKKYDKKFLPIILNTSNNKRENITRAMEVGINDYIIKPFPKELLISKIHRLEREIPLHNIKLSETISKIPFFHSVTKSQVAYALSTCSKIITKKKGEIVCTQDEENYDIFILMEGKCDVMYNDKIISTIEPIDTIGEIGFLEEQKRSATVIATEPSKLIVLKKEPFDNFLNEDRAVSEIICKNVIHTLSKRIKRSNMLVEQLKILTSEHIS